jgi:DNA mismatch repair protein MutL
MGVRIHILPDPVVDKIAAGEVVERPASVVKELIENALDAGARRVEVRLAAGGRDRIEVTDDGGGMSPEDARLALRRHATSKIAGESDLETLDTYGFRGEALPSIAAVSRLVLETGDGEGPGVRLIVEGGLSRGEEPLARVRGTTVRVEHLFANVPARRKFLRAPQTEYRHVLASVSEAALARLETGFRLEHEGREVFDLPPGQGLRERAQALFGRRTLEGSVTLAVSSGGLRLSGLLGAPSAARRTSQGVHIFVHGRPIAHRGLSYALYTGYGELLPAGHYPFACLFLETGAGQVDVNVHPAKREVRFSDEPGMRDFLLTSVRDALSRELGARPLRLAPTGGYRRPEEGGGGGAGSGVLEGHPWRYDPVFGKEQARQAALELFAAYHETEGGEGAAPGGDLAGVSAAAPSEPVIWQVHGRYLLAPIKGGLLVLDQHAAHERILFEEVLARLTGTPAASQQLLFPHVLDVSGEQYALLDEVGPLLERVGFTVRPFGGNTLSIEAVPPEVERAGRQEEVLLALLDDLLERGARGSGVQEKIAASLACHAAIRFGDRLDPDERRALVDRLFACERPQVCPHGRPTHFVLTLDELDQRFGR